MAITATFLFTFLSALLLARSVYSPESKRHYDSSEQLSFLRHQVLSPSSKRALPGLESGHSGTRNEKQPKTVLRKRLLDGGTGQPNPRTVRPSLRNESSTDNTSVTTNQTRNPGKSATGDPVGSSSTAIAPKHDGESSLSKAVSLDQNRPVTAAIPPVLPKREIGGSKKIMQRNNFAQKNGKQPNFNRIYKKRYTLKQPQRSTNTSSLSATRLEKTPSKHNLVTPVKRNGAAIGHRTKTVKSKALLRAEDSAEHLTRLPSVTPEYVNERAVIAEVGKGPKNIPTQSPRTISEIVVPLEELPKEKVMGYGRRYWRQPSIAKSQRVYRSRMILPSKHASQQTVEYGRIFYKSYVQLRAGAQEGSPRARMTPQQQKRASAGTGGEQIFTGTLRPWQSLSRNALKSAKRGSLYYETQDGVQRVTSGFPSSRNKMNDKGEREASITVGTTESQFYGKSQSMRYKEVPHSPLPARGITPTPIPLSVWNPEQRFRNAVLPSLRENQNSGEKFPSLVGKTTKAFEKTLRHPSPNSEELEEVMQHRAPFNPSDEAADYSTKRQVIAHGPVSAMPLFETSAKNRNVELTPPSAFTRARTGISPKLATPSSKYTHVMTPLVPDRDSLRRNALFAPGSTKTQIETLYKPVPVQPPRMSNAIANQLYTRLPDDGTRTHQHRATPLTTTQSASFSPLKYAKGKPMLETKQNVPFIDNNYAAFTATGQEKLVSVSGPKQGKAQASDVPSFQRARQMQIHEPRALLHGAISANSLPLPVPGKPLEVARYDAYMQSTLSSAFQARRRHMISQQRPIGNAVYKAHSFLKQQSIRSPASPERGNVRAALPSMGNTGVRPTYAHKTIFTRAPRRLGYGSTLQRHEIVESSRTMTQPYAVSPSERQKMDPSQPTSPTTSTSTGALPLGWAPQNLKAQVSYLASHNDASDHLYFEPLPRNTEFTRRKAASGQKNTEVRALKAQPLYSGKTFAAATSGPNQQSERALASSRRRNAREKPLLLPTTNINQGYTSRSDAAASQTGEVYGTVIQKSTFVPYRTASGLQRAVGSTGQDQTMYSKSKSQTTLTEASWLPEKERTIPIPMQDLSVRTHSRHPTMTVTRSIYKKPAGFPDGRVRITPTRGSLPIARFEDTVPSPFRENIPTRPMPRILPLVTNRAIARHPHGFLPAQPEYGAKIPQQSSNRLTSKSSGVLKATNAVSRNTAIFQRSGVNAQILTKHSRDGSTHLSRAKPRYNEKPQMPQNVANGKAVKQYGASPSREAGKLRNVTNVYTTDGNSTRIIGRPYLQSEPRALAEYEKASARDSARNIQRTLPRAVLPIARHQKTPSVGMPRKQFTGATQKPKYTPGRSSARTFPTFPDQLYKREAKKGVPPPSFSSEHAHIDTAGVKGAAAAVFESTTTKIFGSADDPMRKHLSNPKSEKVNKPSSYPTEKSNHGKKPPCVTPPPATYVSSTADTGMRTSINTTAKGAGTLEASPTSQKERRRKTHKNEEHIPREVPASRQNTVKQHPRIPHSIHVNNTTGNATLSTAQASTLHAPLPRQVPNNSQPTLTPENRSVGPGARGVYSQNKEQRVTKTTTAQEKVLSTKTRRSQRTGSIPERHSPAGAVTQSPPRTVIVPSNTYTKVTTSTYNNVTTITRNAPQAEDKTMKKQSGIGNSGQLNKRIENTNLIRKRGSTSDTHLPPTQPNDPHPTPTLQQSSVAAGGGLTRGVVSYTSEGIVTKKTTVHEGIVPTGTTALNVTDSTPTKQSPGAIESKTRKVTALPSKTGSTVTRIATPSHVTKITRNVLVTKDAQVKPHSGSGQTIHVNKRTTITTLTGKRESVLEAPPKSTQPKDSPTTAVLEKPSVGESGGLKRSAVSDTTEKAVNKKTTVLETFPSKRITGSNVTGSTPMRQSPAVTRSPKRTPTTLPSNIHKSVARGTTQSNVTKITRNVLVTKGTRVKPHSGSGQPIHVNKTTTRTTLTGKRESVLEAPPKSTQPKDSPTTAVPQQPSVGESGGLKRSVVSDTTEKAVNKKTTVLETFPSKRITGSNVTGSTPMRQSPAVTRSPKRTPTTLPSNIHRSVARGTTQSNVTKITRNVLVTKGTRVKPHSGSGQPIHVNKTTTRTTLTGKRESVLEAPPKSTQPKDSPTTAVPQQPSVGESGGLKRSVVSDTTENIVNKKTTVREGSPSKRTTGSNVAGSTPMRQSPAVTRIPKRTPTTLPSNTHKSVARVTTQSNVTKITRNVLVTKGTRVKPHSGSGQTIHVNKRSTRTTLTGKRESVLEAPPKSTQPKDSPTTAVPQQPSVGESGGLKRRVISDTTENIVNKKTTVREGSPSKRTTGPNVAGSIPMRQSPAVTRIPKRTPTTLPSNIHKSVARGTTQSNVTKITRNVLVTKGTRVKPHSGSGQPIHVNKTTTRTTLTGKRESVLEAPPKSTQPKDSPTTAVLQQPPAGESGGLKRSVVSDTTEKVVNKKTTVREGSPSKRTTGSNVAGSTPMRQSPAVTRSPKRTPTTLPSNIHKSVARVTTQNNVTKITRTVPVTKGTRVKPHSGSGQPIHVNKTTTRTTLTGKRESVLEAPPKSTQPKDSPTTAVLQQPPAGESGGLKRSVVSDTTEKVVNKKTTVREGSPSKGTTGPNVTGSTPMRQSPAVTRSPKSTPTTLPSNIHKSVARVTTQNNVTKITRNVPVTKGTRVKPHSGSGQPIHVNKTTTRTTLTGKRESVLEAPPKSTQPKDSPTTTVPQQPPAGERGGVKRRVVSDTTENIVNKKTTVREGSPSKGTTGPNVAGSTPMRQSPAVTRSPKSTPTTLPSNIHKSVARVTTQSNVTKITRNVPVTKGTRVKPHSGSGQPIHVNKTTTRTTLTGKRESVLEAPPKSTQPKDSPTTTVPQQPPAGERGGLKRRVVSDTTENIVNKKTTVREGSPSKGTTGPNVAGSTPMRQSPAVTRSPKRTPTTLPSNIHKSVARVTTQSNVTKITRNVPVTKGTRVKPHSGSGQPIHVSKTTTRTTLTGKRESVLEAPPKSTQPKDSPTTAVPQQPPARESGGLKRRVVSDTTENIVNKKTTVREGSPSKRTTGPNVAGSTPMRQSPAVTRSPKRTPMTLPSNTHKSVARVTTQNSVTKITRNVLVTKGTRVKPHSGSGQTIHVNKRTTRTTLTGKRESVLEAPPKSTQPKDSPTTVVLQQPPAGESGGLKRNVVSDTTEKVVNKKTTVREGSPSKRARGSNVAGSTPMRQSPAGTRSPRMIPTALPSNIHKAVARVTTKSNATKRTRNIPVTEDTRVKPHSGSGHTSHVNKRTTRTTLTGKGESVLEAPPKSTQPKDSLTTPILQQPSVGANEVTKRGVVLGANEGIATKQTAVHKVTVSTETTVSNIVGSVSKRQTAAGRQNVSRAMATLPSSTTKATNDNSRPTTLPPRPSVGEREGMSLGGKSCTGVAHRKHASSEQHRSPVTINSTITRYITLTHKNPRNGGDSALHITTTTVENQTIEIPVRTATGKFSSVVSAISKITESRVSSASVQNPLLRMLSRVHATSHSNNLLTKLFPFLTSECAILRTATRGVSDKTYATGSLIKNIKNNIATLTGPQPLFRLRSTTKTVTDIVKPIEGGLFNTADVTPSPAAIGLSKTTPSIRIDTGGPTKPSIPENARKGISATLHPLSDQRAAHRESSPSEVQTKGEPCRLRPQLPPVLKCRFKCDNPKHREQYEMEKDGTPCHFHTAVRSLIGVCVNGWCQQAANK